MALSPPPSLFIRQVIGISDEEFKAFRDFIYAQSGIWVDDNRKYLFENRFGSRLKELGLKSFGEYLKLLRFDPRRDEEMKRVFELVTTNETSLFRDTKQLDGFRSNILNPLVEARRKTGNLEIKIWSAGCSSGEEPHTLAIMFHEMLGVEVKKWRIEINALDISPPMIAKAKAGIFSEYAFKTTPEIIKKKYFSPTPCGLKISAEVAALIKFQLGNLNDPIGLKRIPKSDVVFCRNVIIYFDEAMRKRVVGAFYDNLVPTGYLVLGHSESLHKISSAFRPVFIPGSIAYQKV
jgi:chemotaxis protein methyltransferase CheR